jgi:transposase InsO family protein
MFWHALSVLLAPVYVVALRLLGDDPDRLILALRQQVLILQRQLVKRPTLTQPERLALVLACAGMARRRLLDALMIVRPETLVRWHREIVRRRWRLRSRRRPGRPPADPEAERLILRLARENHRWGYTKIAGEMRKLGFGGFGRTTVRRILRKHALAPSPQRRRGLTWPEFVGHYGRFVWACDFFTVTTATLRTYYVFMVLEISTRRIRFWNVSASPDGRWTAQQFRNLSVVSGDLPRHLIHDRDDKFTAHADALLAAAGTEVMRLPARSPDLNGHIERCIRTLREECLDRIIILNDRHLRWVLDQFVRYYNRRRPHRSLQLHVPEGPRDYPTDGRVARRQILGGLVSDYYRKAA